MGSIGHSALDVGNARQAINALRDGVPPPDDAVEWLTVGQSQLTKLFVKGLETSCVGGFAAHLLVGVPGAGKSHFFAHIRKLARDRQCVISYCVQDRTTRTTLNRPDLVYREIVARLQLPASDGIGDPLTAIIQRWSALAEPLVNRSRPGLSRLYTLAAAGLVPKLDSLPRRTGLALVGYLLALEAMDSDAQGTMINVIRGLPIENRAVIEVAKRCGLVKANVGFTPGPYDIKFWLQQLSALCHLIRAAQFGGTILLLDELESLIDLPRADSRAKAYKVLHALLFNDFGAPGLLTACAFTPAFVTGLKRDVTADGDKFHKEWETFWKNNYSELVGLTRMEARELIGRIAILHGEAYKWDASRFCDHCVDGLVSDWFKHAKPVGDLVRSCVARLDTGQSRQR